MDIEKIKENYPDIIHIIKAVEYSKSDCTSFYTLKIQRENNPKKLRQWISYLIEVDVVKVAAIIRKIKLSDEKQKAELENLILEKINVKKRTYSKKIINNILILIYLNKYDILKQLYSDINKVKKVHVLEQINSGVVHILLKESQYNLIFEYILFLVKIGEYQNVRKATKKFNLAPKGENYTIIKEIAQRLIDSNMYFYAFEFLNNILVKKYKEFLPENTDLMKSIQLLNDSGESLISLLIQKQLFFEANIGINYKNVKDILKAWIEFLDNNRILNDKILLIKIYTLFELILDDKEALKDKYILQKISEYSKELVNLNVYYKNNIINIKLVKILNEILKDNKDNLEIVINYYNILENLNFFKFSQLNKKKMIYMSSIKYTSIRTESKLIFEQILKEVNSSNLEQIVYIYMNSFYRYVLPIEEFFNKVYSNIMIEDIDSIIQKLFETYEIYCVFKEKKRNYSKLKLLNIKSYNKPRIYSNKELNNNYLVGEYGFAKIQKYNQIYDEIEVYDIKMIKQQSKVEIQTYSIATNEPNATNNVNLIDKYIEIYECAINSKLSNISLKTLNLDFIEDNLEKIIKEQIKILNYLHQINVINLFKKDKINPYLKFENNTNVIAKKYVEFITKIREITFNLVKDDNEYRDKVISRFKEILQNTQIDVEDIIYYYMNSCCKYIINLNIFFNLLIEFRLSKEIGNKVVMDMSNYFKDYSVIFAEIENTKVLELLEFSKSDIYLYSSNIKYKFNQYNLYYFKGYIKEYDIVNNKIIIEKLDIVNLIKKTKNLNLLENYLNKFMETEEEQWITKIKNIDEISEFVSMPNLMLALNSYHFNNYKLLCNKIFFNLFDNINKLYNFIKALNKNNIWCENVNNVSYEFWKLNLDVLNQGKKVFFNSIKQITEEEIVKIIYCYKNSNLKQIVTLEELIKNIFLYNPKIYEVVKKQEIINLNNYDLNIPVKVLEIEEKFVILKSLYNESIFKVLCKDKNTLNIDDVINIKVKEYDLIYDRIYCIKKNDVDILENLVIKSPIGVAHPKVEYSNLLNKRILSMLNKNENINNITLFLNLNSQKNLRNGRKINLEYVKLLRQDIELGQEFILATENYICNLNIEQFELNNLIFLLFRIYDETSLKYFLNIIEYFNILANKFDRELFNIDYFEKFINIKVNSIVNKRNNEYILAYLMNYDKVMKIKISNIKNYPKLTIGEKYKIKFINVDVKNNMILAKLIK